MAKENIKKEDIKLIIDELKLQYGSCFMREMPGLTAQQAIDGWHRSLKIFNRDIISSVMKMIKRHKGTYAKYPPNLKNFRDECIAQCIKNSLIPSLEEFAKKTLGILKVRKSIFTKTIYDIESHNEAQMRCSLYHHEKPNIIPLDPYVLWSEVQNKYPYDFGNPFISYLFNRYSEEEILEKIEDIYFDHIEEYIGEKLCS